MRAEEAWGYLIKWFPAQTPLLQTTFFFNILQNRHSIKTRQGLWAHKTLATANWAVWHPKEKLRKDSTKQPSKKSQLCLTRHLQPTTASSLPTARDTEVSWSTELLLHSTSYSLAGLSAHIQQVQRTSLPSPALQSHLPPRKPRFSFPFLILFCQGTELGLKLLILHHDGLFSQSKVIRTRNKTGNRQLKCKYFPYQHPC